jgi:hypothetical protein
VKIRRIRGWLALCAAIALIPWTVYLGLTLPQSYSAQHWQATWVGFDVLLLMFMCATAVLGFTHHHLLTLFAFTTGVLLVCDARFDVLTARRADFAVAVLTAARGELPLAAMLIVGTLRIVRLQGPPLVRARWPFPARGVGLGAAVKMIAPSRRRWRRSCVRVPTARIAGGGRRLGERGAA